MCKNQINLFKKLTKKTMNYKKLEKKASLINEALEWEKRDNGSEFIKAKETTSENLKKEISEIVGNATGFNICNMDDGFKTLWDITDLILECESEEQLEERIYEEEGLIYTKDLTEWLNSNISNIYHLTEVLKEFEPKDGFSLLQLAYCKAYQQEMLEMLREIEKTL